MAGAVAVVLAASVGLAVALLVPESSPQPPPAAEVHPISETGPDPTKVEPDLTGLTAFYSRHVTPQRGFVVFGNGSVVLFAEPCDDPLSKARETLDRCAEP